MDGEFPVSETRSQNERQSDNVSVPAGREVKNAVENVPVRRPAASSSVASSTDRPPLVGTPGRVSSPASSIDEELRAEKAGAMVMAVRMAQRRGNKDEARTLLQKALTLHPTDCAALELLGDIFLEEGEQEKALKVFERGRAYHPHHVAFEEKIALCILDLEEMKRDKEMQQQLLEGEKADPWLDLKPNRALGLSLLLPGAGHVYNGDIARGAAFLGAMVVTFCGWFLLLYFGLKNAKTAGARNLMDGIDVAIGNMGSLAKFAFWLMLLAWIAIYIVAAFDALLGAQRANEARKRFLGV